MAPNASNVDIPIESYGIKEYESNFNEGIVSAKRVFANFLQYQNRSQPLNKYPALHTRLAFQEQLGHFTFETRQTPNQTFEETILCPFKKRKFISIKLITIKFKIATVIIIIKTTLSSQCKRRSL